jgi:lipopolysaccharide export system protein LptA
MKKHPSSLLVLAAALISLSVHAERGDRDKPINLEADTVDVNDATKVSIYQGHVRLSQGTLLILGDKLVVKQDAEGLSDATAYGNPASFRQKRDGVDEYIEGYAQRIEYDAHKDKLELFVNARVKRGEDEVRGSYISYDGNTEFFQVKGGKEAVTEHNPKGRVRAVIQPKSKNPPPAAKGGGINLKPAEGVQRDN